jgi:hypothetical protein
MSRVLLLDDHALIEEILTGSISAREPESSLLTTSYWYYRACRGAVLGAGGQLSGPFEQLADELQEAAIATLLTLPERVELPDPRTTVPLMVAVGGRHPKLNLLNLEAVAVAVSTGAHVLLADRAATGILPGVLAAEEVDWSSNL